MPRTHPRNLTLAALTVALFAVPMTMSGCLVASSKHTTITGAYAQPSSVSQVRLHETTTTEVEESLGEPTHKATNDDGSETWTWHWTESKGDAGAVLLIFAGSSEKTVSESLHIKFVDGIAVKKWRD